MKILYITNARIPTEKAHGVAIVKTCESFARAGATVRLVVPRRRKSSPEALKHYNVQPIFDIVFLPTIDLYGTFVPARLCFFLQTWSFYASTKIWLLFRSRSWTIYTRDILPLFFSWLGYKTVLECHLISKQRGLFFFAARRTSRIITISRALKDAFVHSGFDEKKILVAPSGVDLSTFDITVSKEDARKQLNLPQDARIAVYTGNFTTMGQDKGISDILAALKSSPDTVFVATGGSEADIARYAREATERKVSERVMLRGQTPQSQLALYQKAADVLLMPFPDTLHYRNHMSPVKMFEYMAAQRPVVASDLPTIREVLNEANAYIVAPGDTAAIARTLADIFAQPEEARSRAEQAYREVVKFTWSERARRILAFI